MTRLVEKVSGESRLRWWYLENLMRRPAIPEFADLSWTPSTYRKYVQEALVFLYRSVPQAVFIPLAEDIARFLRQEQIQSVTILGAGAGGPIFRLQKYFLSQGLTVHFKLTDVIPNPELVQSTDDLLIDYEISPVDALEVQPSKPGHALMMIGCFHHFDEAQARRLIGNFQDENNIVYILEVSTRNWLNPLCSFLFWLPVTLFAPFIRPFSWSRIFFSWVVPIFPLMFIIDGIISGLRTYSKREFLALGNPNPNYEWEIQDFSFMGGLFTCRSYVGHTKR